jgi:hypothetical protein
MQRDTACTLLCVGQEPGPRFRVDTNDQLVGAEGLAVGEDATAEPDRAVEILLGAGGVEPYRIDGGLTQEPGRNKR